MSTIQIKLSAHYEKAAPRHDLPIKNTDPPLLYHQLRTYEALKTHHLVVNTYNTGTGKTRASLLHLLDPQTKGQNVLFIAPTNELIAQHTRDIEGFVSRYELNYHTIHIDAQHLKELSQPSEWERSGERLVNLLSNPRDYGWDGKKNIIAATNSDIFYYILYFSAYNPHDKRNLFEKILGMFDYIVIDEFHYYNPKQLACFLFYFLICREWGLLEAGRKICLLSATPEPKVTEYLENIFGSKVAFISPNNEPVSNLPLLPTLSPVVLEIAQDKSIEDYIYGDVIEKICQYIKTEKKDGVIISSALWKINLIHTNLKPKLSQFLSRITGAQQTTQRRMAPAYPLVLATPTVDIGYNFDKPNKTRQPIDFIFFDATTRDQFLQRLGRAGRVLGRTETQTDSLAYALINVDDEIWTKLLYWHGKEVNRADFVGLAYNTLPQRNDLYSYMNSYGIIETLRPMFNIKQTLRPDLEDYLKNLFDAVCDVFAPNNTHWRYSSIRQKIGEMQNIYKASQKDSKPQDLLKILDKWIDWREANISSDERIKLSKGIEIAHPRVCNPLKEWACGQNAINEALFSFRESLPSLSACIYDPQHLLADSDETIYDVLHITANYDVNWFQNQKEYESFIQRESSQSNSSKALLYGVIRSRREQRLTLILDYRSNLCKFEFEKLYCLRVAALKDVRIKTELRGQKNIPYQIAPQVTHLYEQQHLPVLLAAKNTKESGLMKKKIKGSNIFSQRIDISFSDGTSSEYVGVIGSAIFFVDSELGSFFRMQRYKQSKEAIVI